MARDFIADLLYFLFAEDKKAHPMSKEQQTRFFDKIQALLKGRDTSANTQNEGE